MLRKLTKEADGAMVYDFALACTDYFTDWQKNTPTQAEVLADIFEDQPPETAPNQKEEFAIMEQGTMIGLIDLLHDYPETGTTILGLFVLKPAFRNQGLGQKYYDQIEAYCREKKRVKMRLGVIQTNQVGQIMWSKQGFQPVTETDTPYGEMTVMEKLLSH